MPMTLMERLEAETKRAIDELLWNPTDDESKKSWPTRCSLCAENNLDTSFGPAKITFRRNSR